MHSCLMSQTMAFVAGCALVVLVFVDALVTTLFVAKGAGPLTRRFAGLLWRGLLRFHRRDSHARWLTVGGPVLLIATVMAWVIALWAGWVLVFLGSHAVVNDSSGAPAGLVDVVYFTGFLVFTLGTGDFVAVAPLWRLVTDVAAFSGLFLVTLSITYLISVVSAVVSRRTLAIHVSALGDSAAQILTLGWNGERFSPELSQQLVTLTDKVTTIAEQHLAYPVLHYFHTPDRSTSAPIGLAHLEDAMLMLTYAVAPAARPDTAAVRPLRTVIDRYVTTASATSALPEPGEPPPVPSLRPLSATTIPVVAETEFQQSVAKEAQRRKALCRLVHGDGWSWTPAD